MTIHAADGRHRLLRRATMALLLVVLASCAAGEASPPEPTVEDITLMRRVVGPDMGVKASGGVRDYAGAIALLRAGANRLGCSSSVAIVSGQQSSGGY